MSIKVEEPKEQPSYLLRDLSTGRYGITSDGYVYQCIGSHTVVCLNNSEMGYLGTQAIHNATPKIRILKPGTIITIVVE